jgi:hypothetical protein
MSNAILVTVMITEKDCAKLFCSQGDCAHNPTIEITTTQNSAKIIEQNKRTRS